MRHLADGTLRRLCDDPLALTPRQRAHLAGCDTCMHRFTTIQHDARVVATLFSVPPPSADPLLALAALRARMATTDTAPLYDTLRACLDDRRIVLTSGRKRRLLVKPFAALAIAVAVLALALTPAGSLAAGMLTIFQPKQFVAVRITGDELRSLPNLAHYGTMDVPASTPQRKVASRFAASAVLGAQLLVPGWLPSGVPRYVTYDVMAVSRARFTFSAAKVRAAAAATGKMLPAMPAALDGSTLQATVGPAVLAVYGPSTTGFRALPALLIAQALLPSVTSTHASVRTIESYLLDQPGISPDLAAQIRAIGDPATTLPMPIPINLAVAHAVQVHGMSGIAIGDNTGAGSGVIWHSGRMVYAVVGGLTEQQVLRIADSLQ